MQLHNKIRQKTWESEAVSRDPHVVQVVPHIICSLTKILEFDFSRNWRLIFQVMRHTEGDAGRTQKWMTFSLMISNKERKPIATQKLWNSVGTISVSATPTVELNVSSCLTSDAIAIKDAYQFRWMVWSKLLQPKDLIKIRIISSKGSVTRSTKKSSKRRFNRLYFAALVLKLPLSRAR